MATSILFDVKLKIFANKTRNALIEDEISKIELFCPNCQDFDVQLENKSLQEKT